jgi:chloramphenicol 3-O-phosphotransferase
MEIQQNNGGRSQVFLLRELVQDRKRLIAIVDDLEHVGELMGVEHPANQVDVHRIIVHDKNGEWQRGSLHDGHFSVEAVRASHTTPWECATQASHPA